MMRSLPSLPLLVIAAMLTISACSGDDPVTPAPDTSVSFADDVRPLFTKHGCAGCHGGTSGLTVTSVDQLLSGGEHGPAIVAGSPDSSLLIRKLSATPPFGSRMPLDRTPMPDDEVQIIRNWIAQGARNN